MRQIPSMLLLALLGVLLAVSSIHARPEGRSTALALASTGGSYTLDWSTIDGGGGTSGNGSVTLSGTLGQPDAGIVAGGPYTLAGGYWAGAQPNYRLRLPLLKR